eukprot:scaffold763_cov402-Prasinococcus_capsulatus_cf.AAC.12
MRLAGPCDARPDQQRGTHVARLSPDPSKGRPWQAVRTMEGPAPAPVGVEVDPADDHVRDAVHVGLAREQDGVEEFGELEEDGLGQLLALLLGDEEVEKGLPGGGHGEEGGNGPVPELAHAQPAAATDAANEGRQHPQGQRRVVEALGAPHQAIAEVHIASRGGQAVHQLLHREGAVAAAVAPPPRPLPPLLLVQPGRGLRLGGPLERPPVEVGLEEEHVRVVAQALVLVVHQPEVAAGVQAMLTPAQVLHPRAGPQRARQDYALHALLEEHELHFSARPELFARPARVLLVALGAAGQVLQEVQTLLTDLHQHQALSWILLSRSGALAR